MIIRDAPASHFATTHRSPIKTPHSHAVKKREKPTHTATKNPPLAFPSSIYLIEQRTRKKKPIHRALYCSRRTHLIDRPHLSTGTHLTSQRELARSLCAHAQKCKQRARPDAMCSYIYVCRLEKDVIIGDLLHKPRGVCTTSHVMRWYIAARPRGVNVL